MILIYDWNCVSYVNNKTYAIIIFTYTLRTITYKVIIMIIYHNHINRGGTKSSPLMTLKEIENNLCIMANRNFWCPSKGSTERVLEPLKTGTPGDTNHKL